MDTFQYLIDSAKFTWLKFTSGSLRETRVTAFFNEMFHCLPTANIYEYCNLRPGGYVVEFGIVIA